MAHGGPETVPDPWLLGVGRPVRLLAQAGERPGAVEDGGVRAVEADDVVPAVHDAEGVRAYRGAEPNGDRAVVVPLCGDAVQTDLCVPRALRRSRVR